jgi:lipopolysaccharide/colanic/teichoic acid biosynthesis glycosyltransferase
MKLQESITGFYYVGTKRANITKLVKIYKRGFASSNLNQAMADLVRKDAAPPEVICCEGRLGMTAIRQWADLLSGQERLARVPFIIDEDKMTARENDHFIRNRTVDEILNLEELDEDSLLAKIRFLQKFKTRNSELEKQEYESKGNPVPGSINAFLKRCLDVIISVTALFFLAPVFLLIALAIRLESRGSIFYVSKRAGKGYRIFNFYKFRTMVPGADQFRKNYAHLNQYQDSEVARFFKAKDDPRITRVGRFLRNSSLDELPQLFNVLLGDMSLVGNRPLPLYEAEWLTTNRLAKRFLAPAGITGLWQIRKRGRTEMSEDERIGLDIDYADKSNLLFDIWIMANTPHALLQKENT